MYNDKKNGLYKLIMNVCKKNAVLPRRLQLFEFNEVFIKILHNFS